MCLFVNSKTINNNNQLSAEPILLSKELLTKISGGLNGCDFTLPRPQKPYRHFKIVYAHPYLNPCVK